ncbi:MAG: type IX secretion system membrane protein PorP/SprF [Bacteroidales bacterium]|nr:type IX secretion system membrane protein PorP/SprF [Bacteroidales bacterium]
MPVYHCYIKHVKIFLRYLFLSILFIWSPIITVKLVAQISYPFQYYQFYRNISLYNPAGSGLTAPLELQAGNHSYISYLNAQYSCFNANMRFGMGRSNPGIFSTVGLRFTGYNEGKYISGNRLYAVYSFHARLKNRCYFAGGIDLGFIHSRIEGTPSTGDLSEYVIDGNAGIIFYNDRFHAGLSVNQLANNFIKPLQEIIILYRHAVLSASNRFTISENFQVSPFTRLCYPYFDKLRIELGTNVLFLKRYNVSVSYRFKEMGSVGIGIHHIKVGNGHINAGLTYNTPIRSNVIYTSTVEISLGYFISKKQKEGYFFTL